MAPSALTLLYEEWPSLIVSLFKVLMESATVADGARFGGAE